MSQAYHHFLNTYRHNHPQISYAQCRLLIKPLWQKHKYQLLPITSNVEINHVNALPELSIHMIPDLAQIVCEYLKQDPCIKSCSHRCELSNGIGIKCCACSDLRPIEQRNPGRVTQNIYVDGQGFAQQTISRSRYYCPLCRVAP